MTRPALLVDAHVHVHACFTWRAFLDAAAANFARARQRCGVTADSPGCLMLTETAGATSYRALLNDSTLALSVGWRAEPCDDRRSIVLSRGAGETLVIIAGRQIVTVENLEVLALGSTDEFADGRPVGDALRAVVDRGALAVIPWGFGKWTARRGRIVRGLLDSGQDAPFCLGDNGGRARLIPRPRLLVHAEHRGVPVLAGSDPLPLPREVNRAGGYGFLLEDWQATSRPAAAIKARIQALRCSPAVFGELSSLRAVVRSQLHIRWQRQRTRAGRREAAVA